MRGHVQVRTILGDHAFAVELSTHILQRLLHAPHPFDGHPVVPPLIEHGDDFILQQRVETRNVGIIALRRIRVSATDGPTAGRFRSLIEPAVRNTKIEHAVHAGFHTAGAASFFSATRIVQPNIDRAHQFTGHLHPVIFHEEHTMRKFWIRGMMNNFTDERFARRIQRMSLARDENLHRTGGVVQNTL